MSTFLSLYLTTFLGGEPQNVNAPNSGSEAWAGAEVLLPCSEDVKIEGIMPVNVLDLAGGSTGK